MSDAGEDGVLEIPVFVEYDLEVNPDGILQLRTDIWVDEDTSTEVVMSFCRIVDGLIDPANTDRNFTHLFAIANDLTREAERIREVAIKIEDSTENVADLFNTSFDPT